MSPSHVRSTTYLFQSSPGQKAGCNSILRRRQVAAPVFQSSPGQKAGCNAGGFVGERLKFLFQSSPGQKAGCNRGPVDDPVYVLDVSILTRPEGRMQPSHTRAFGVDVSVSILTRPEGRMQQVCQPCREYRALEFQSSPGQKAGCNVLLVPSPTPQGMFQSSPGQKAGCNRRPNRHRSSLSQRFNPHPARRPDATTGC